jgi:acyl-coenzyme A thioesterase PaaI-like protein
VVHGGIVAAIMDEVSCAAVFFTRDRFVATGELTVRYQRPCPVGRPLDFDARIVDEVHPRYAVVEAEARDGETVLARSRGKFFYQARPGAVP